jgi:hypothetical protein
MAGRSAVSIATLPRRNPINFARTYFTPARAIVEGHSFQCIFNPIPIISTPVRLAFCVLRHRNRAISLTAMASEEGVH